MLHMSKTEYRRYVRSKDFDRRIRQPALARAAGRCESCGTPTRWLAIHHEDYFAVRTANELQVVRAICGRCHLRAHGPAARQTRVSTRIECE